MSKVKPACNVLCQTQPNQNSNRTHPTILSRSSKANRSVPNVVVKTEPTTDHEMVVMDSFFDHIYTPHSTEMYKNPRKSLMLDKTPQVSCHADNP